MTQLNSASAQGTFDTSPQDFFQAQTSCSGECGDHGIHCCHFLEFQSDHWRVALHECGMATFLEIGLRLLQPGF